MLFEPPAPSSSPHHGSKGIVLFLVSLPPNAWSQFSSVAPVSQSRYGSGVACKWGGNDEAPADPVVIRCFLQTGADICLQPQLPVFFKTSGIRSPECPGLNPNPLSHYGNIYSSKTKQGSWSLGALMSLLKVIFSMCWPSRFSYIQVIVIHKGLVKCQRDCGRSCSVSSGLGRKRDPYLWYLTFVFLSFIGLQWPCTAIFHEPDGPSWAVQPLLTIPWRWRSHTLGSFSVLVLSSVSVV